jgi:anti-anti-sigma regulatory factor
MASNFEIVIEKKSDGVVLKLQGDFDATSAYELIYAITIVQNRFSNEQSY